MKRLIVSGIFGFFVFIASLAIISTVSFGQTVPNNNGKYIVDTANVLNTQQLSALNEKLAGLEKTIKDHPQVVVLLVPTTGEDDIDTFSTHVFDKWKPGVEDVDNGLLLVIATSDRKVAIKPGRGLEGNITDTQTRQITDFMKPALAAGFWFDGVDKFIDAVKPMLIANANESVIQDKPHSNNYWWVLLILPVAFFGFCLYWSSKMKQEKAKLEALRQARNVKNTHSYGNYTQATNRTKRSTNQSVTPTLSVWNTDKKSESTSDSGSGSGFLSGIIAGSLLNSDTSNNDSSSSISSSSFDSGGGDSSGAGSSDSF